MRREAVAVIIVALVIIVSGGWSVALEVSLRTKRYDPILPMGDTGHRRLCGLEGVEATNTHFMDDEQGWERRVTILDVEANSFPVEWLKQSVVGPGIVHEYKLLNLFLVNMASPEIKVTLTSERKRMKKEYLSNAE